MSHRRWIAPLALAIVTLLPPRDVASQVPIPGVAGWQPGDYWVVTSERKAWAPDIQTGGATWSSRSAGVDRTRFLVTARTPEIVQIELVSAGPDESYAAVGYGVRLTIDLRNCRVTKVVSYGYLDDGSPNENGVVIAPEVFPYFELVQHAPYLSDSLEVLWPAFTCCETTSPTLQDAAKGSDGLLAEAYAQKVAVAGDVVSLRLWSGPGAEHLDPAAAIPRTLVYRPAQPWPDVLDEQGHVVNAVVEVGHLP